MIDRSIGGVNLQLGQTIGLPGQVQGPLQGQAQEVSQDGPQGTAVGEDQGRLLTFQSALKGQEGPAGAAGEGLPAGRRGEGRVGEEGVGPLDLTPGHALPLAEGLLPQLRQHQAGQAQIQGVKPRPLEIDRTGLFTAFLLTALGVPRETVFADYLLSNEYILGSELYREAVRGAQEQFGAGVIRDDTLKPVLGVEPAYLEAAFEAIGKRYPSFESYADSELGISAADVEQLRAELIDRTFWCHKTQNCLGPDGKVADEYECNETRGCYKPL